MNAWGMGCMAAALLAWPAQAGTPAAAPATNQLAQLCEQACIAVASVTAESAPKLEPATFAGLEFCDGDGLQIMAPDGALLYKQGQGPFFTVNSPEAQALLAKLFSQTAGTDQMLFRTPQSGRETVRSMAWRQCLVAGQVAVILAAGAAAEHAQTYRIKAARRPAPRPAQPSTGAARPRLPPPMANEPDGVLAGRWIGAYTENLRVALVSVAAPAEGFVTPAGPVSARIHHYGQRVQVDLWDRDTTYSGEGVALGEHLSVAFPHMETNQAIGLWIWQAAVDPTNGTLKGLFLGNASDCIVERELYLRRMPDQD